MSTPLQAAGPAPAAPGLPLQVPAGALLLLMALTALGQMATNLVVPSLDAIVAELSLEAGSAGLILSTVLLGIGFGQLVVGPLSDRHGRRPVMLGGLALYILAGLGATLATDGGLLLLARFLQGAGASAGLALPRAIARDRYAGPQFLRVMSLLTLAMAVMPGLAPILGGAVSGAFGWRASLALSTAAGGAALVAVLLALPESHHRRVSGGGVAAVLRGYGQVLRNRDFLACALASGAAIGGAYAEMASAQRLYGGLHGWSPTAQGLATAAYAAAFLLGGLLGPRLLAKPDRRLRAGVALMLAAPLALLAGTALGSVSPFWALGAVMLSQMGVGLMAPSAIGLALMAVEGAAGTASAVMGALHMLVGAAGAALIGALALPILWGLPLVLLGFALLAALCVAAIGKAAPRP